jgi:hypothetical protein
MTVRTSATTTLAISAGVPATFNNAGYVALSYTAVGEVTNFGEFGREFTLVTHNPVASRGTQKLKGAFNEGSIALQLGLDTDDAGQILMKAASASDSLYAFRITTANGDIYYFQGLTMGFKVGLNDVNSVTSATATIEITTSSTGVGIVETLAA